MCAPVWLIMLTWPSCFCSCHCHCSLYNSPFLSLSPIHPFYHLRLLINYLAAAAANARLQNWIKVAYTQRRQRWKLNNYRGRRYTGGKCMLMYDAAWAECIWMNSLIWPLHGNPLAYYSYAALVKTWVQQGQLFLQKLQPEMASDLVLY